MSQDKHVVFSQEASVETLDLVIPNQTDNNIDTINNISTTNTNISTTNTSDNNSQEHKKEYLYRMPSSIMGDC